MKPYYSLHRRLETPDNPSPLARRRHSRLSLTLISAGLCAGLAPATALADPAFSDWTGTTAVAGLAGGCPIESRSGNELYTAGGFDGTLDVWIYARSGRRGEFGPRSKAGAPVSLDTTNDYCPTPLPGGWLLFVSNRPGGCGGVDIYMARYSADSPEPRDEEAVNLGCHPNGPNTAGTELSPSLVTTPEGNVLFYSSDTGGDQDVYQSMQAPDGSFGAGVPAAGINTGFADQQPNVSKDGLEMVFSSNRDATQDVFSATRTSLNAPWSNVRNLTLELGLPTVDGNETRASMSWDRKRLYYGSAGTIFVSERRPEAGSP